MIEYSDFRIGKGYTEEQWRNLSIEERREIIAKQDAIDYFEQRQGFADFENSFLEAINTAFDCYEREYRDPTAPVNPNELSLGRLEAFLEHIYICTPPQEADNFQRRALKYEIMRTVFKHQELFYCTSYDAKNEYTQIIRKREAHIPEGRRW